MRRNLTTTRPAFTLTELLVVIVIVVLLTTMVVTGTSSAIDLARKRNTSVTMANTMLAIETFATDNPLRQVYDRSSPLSLSSLGASGATFGPYPPYQLPISPSVQIGSASAQSPNSLTAARPLQGTTPHPKDLSLATRLAYDMSGTSERSVQSPNWTQNWVRFSTSVDGAPDGNDDNRALSAYMLTFSPRAFSQISPDSLRPLHPLAETGGTNSANYADRIFPRGDGNRPNSVGQDVLGIHDGWGVPLDYLLYIKVGVRLARFPDSGQLQPVYTIIDRRPVLRSRGMNRQTYEEYRRAVVQGNAQTAAALNNPTRWMWSEPLPSPSLRPNTGSGPFNIRENGNFNPSGAPGAVGRAAAFQPGWVRLAAMEWRPGIVASEVTFSGGKGVDYGYLPAFDPGQ